MLENAAGPGAALDPQFQGDRLVGAQLAYKDCGDGTVVDLNTGLMWAAAQWQMKRMSILQSTGNAFALTAREVLEGDSVPAGCRDPG